MTLKNILKNIEKQRESLDNIEYILGVLTPTMAHFQELYKKNACQETYKALQETRKKFAEGMKWQGIYQEQLDKLLVKQEAFLNQSK
jgi:hypothetical protein